MSATALISMVLATVFVVATSSTSFADEPAEAGAVLWLVDQPVDADHNPVLEGIDEALAADRDRHLIGADQLYDRIDEGIDIPSDCARGVDGCGPPEAMAFEALDLGVVVRLAVQRGTDTIEINYEMVDRRGEIVSSGRLEADDERAAGLQLVDSLFDAVGVVSVESAPEGATVSVGDDELGETPISRQFGVGTHDIRLELEGYEPVEQTVEVGAEETHRVDVELQARPARLRIAGAPDGATVLVDGRQAGIADEVLEVEPGRRSVELRADDHEPDRQTIDFEPGRTTEMEVQMTRQPSFLRDVEADEIADHRLQLDVGLEAGGQMARFPGARTTGEGPERLFGGWSVDEAAEDPAGERRLVTPAGLRFGINWEGDRFGLGLLSVSLVRRSVDERFRLVDPVDGSTTTATMTRLTSLQVRPMQLRTRFFYRNLAPFAQGGLGLNLRSMSAETDEGSNVEMRHVDAFGSLELGVRYHFDPRWSVGASYRTQRSLGGASGFEHVLGVQVGVGIRDLPFVDQQPPGEL